MIKLSKLGNLDSVKKTGFPFQIDLMPYQFISVKQCNICCIDFNLYLHHDVNVINNSNFAIFRLIFSPKCKAMDNV